MCCCISHGPSTIVDYPTRFIIFPAISNDWKLTNGRRTENGLSCSLRFSNAKDPSERAETVDLKKRKGYIVERSNAIALSTRQEFGKGSDCEVNGRN